MKKLTLCIVSLLLCLILIGCNKKKDENMHDEYNLGGGSVVDTVDLRKSIHDNTLHATDTFEYTLLGEKYIFTIAYVSDDKVTIEVDHELIDNYSNQGKVFSINKGETLQLSTLSTDKQDSIILKY